MRSKKSESLGPRHTAPARAGQRFHLGEPRPNRALLWSLRLLGGPYARLGLKLDGIEFRHPERLLKAWLEFREGRKRLILAFRHPYGDEPQLLTLALALGLGREARRAGTHLTGPGHALFIHGYEVPLWSGPLVRWLLPRVGAMPVYHSRLDRAGMERIRTALRDGDFPIALAPEGQASYRSETLPRLEQGSARLGLWCAGELRRAGRGEEVELLPISVHYRYDEADIGKLERLVAGLERDCGGTDGGAEVAAAERAAVKGREAGAAEIRRCELAARLVALDGKLIGMAELYYHGRPSAGTGPDRDSRLAALMEEALRRAEAVLGIQAEGDRIARVYAIRQEGWDRVYPELDLEALSPLAGRLADRRAGEAWYAMRHMEFVDLCHYLDSAYLWGEGGGAPSFDRLAETAYSAADLASRLCGGNITNRPKALRHRAVLVVGRAIELTSRYSDYLRDKKGTAEAATGDLEREFQTSIEEYIDERKY